MEKNAMTQEYELRAVNWGKHTKACVFRSLFVLETRMLLSSKCGVGTSH